MVQLIKMEYSHVEEAKDLNLKNLLYHKTMNVINAFFNGNGLLHMVTYIHVVILLLMEEI